MDKPIKHCPALMLTAAASGQGKTSLCAGLARFYHNAGHRVRVFKTGPDFLDPMILERASGYRVYSLDLWMNGLDDCRARLYQAAQDADIILIEGVMGLFDGDPSSADLAEQFGLPLVAVVDASGMADTFAAVVHGLQHYRPKLLWAGVIGNRVGGDHHADLLRDSLPDDRTLLACVQRNDDFNLPSRHLGLVQASEIDDLDARLDRVADAFKGTALASPPAAVAFAGGQTHSALAHADDKRPLQGQTIAVAKDAAFNFIYPANIDLLATLGAEIVYFSPLDDPGLPNADSVYLPGGYPELHLDTLTRNASMRTSIKAFADSDGRIYAECGGMLYLLESLCDTRGHRATMCQVLPGSAVMQDKLAALGMQSTPLFGQQWRGHTFHHSTAAINLPVHAYGIRLRKSKKTPRGEAIYIHKRVVASYIHAYFPSNPSLTATLFGPRNRR